MMGTNSKKFDVAIVGAGFTGLAAAYRLATKGHSVAVLEAADYVGGLAGTFRFSDGVRIEKFYHHWFNNDIFVPQLARELGLESEIVTLPTSTGMYFNGRHWKLSTPLDLMRFTALPFLDRIRLGLLVLQIRRIKDWHAIEHLSIREWLESLAGKQVYKVVWEPLITSKFSVYAEAVNAVWMWKKLVLRGSTRNKKGAEELAYFRGGFGRLADAMVAAIESKGGLVQLNAAVTALNADGISLTSVTAAGEAWAARQFLFTPAFPIIAGIFKDKAPPAWLSSLERIPYLANICLTLRLKKSLSSTYWLNVNDPGFPFVGVIEHTNFDGPENYKGSHIVYLSRYLAKEDPIWALSDAAYFEYALGHLRRMFPELEEDWVIEYNVWRAEFAQPVMERNYSSYVPDGSTPFENASIATMAQIYPEDRGTNYAIREGRLAADDIERRLKSS